MNINDTRKSQKGLRKHKKHKSTKTLDPMVEVQCSSAVIEVTVRRLSPRPRGRAEREVAVAGRSACAVKKCRPAKERGEGESMSGRDGCWRGWWKRKCGSSVGTKRGGES